MREKAEDAINQAIAENKGNPELIAKLNRQKDLLPNSYIQTFDSFCARVIREKGYCAADSDLADVFDPANIVLDETEKAILKNAAAKKAVKLMYDAAKDEQAKNEYSQANMRLREAEDEGRLMLAKRD